MKVASTVLRGGRWSNPPDLLDTICACRRRNTSPKKKKRRQLFFVSIYRICQSENQLGLGKNPKNTNGNGFYI